MAGDMCKSQAEQPCVKPCSPETFIHKADGVQCQRGLLRRALAGVELLLFDNSFHKSQ
jgi:hypothetical protein